MSKCEKGIDCLQCNSRGMCSSYANFKYEQGYNKAIDDLLTHCKGSRNGEGDCFTCVFSCWKDNEWECCYLEKLKQ